MQHTWRNKACRCVHGGAIGGTLVSGANMAAKQFHSDAEAGLGPRVASLSLGSAAYMHFRLHKKYRTDGGTGNVRNSLTLFLRHVSVRVPFVVEYSPDDA